jgi:nitrogen regulatory protein P-II 1
MDWTSSGGETERVETYRGTTVKMEPSDKVRRDIGLSDHFVEPTVKAILFAARTGEVGDGKVFVLPVEKVYRLRAGCAIDSRRLGRPAGS